MMPSQHLPVSPCNTVGFRLVLALAFIIITWMTLNPSPGPITESVNDKLAHMLGFLVLAFLVHGSWPDREFGWKQILPLIAYGLAMETLQHFIPNRSFSLLDLVADIGGIVLYLLMIPLISRILGKKTSSA